MARNVGEAARGSAEIACNITGVASAAKDTTEGASKTRRAAEELAGMATRLQTLVGRFRIMSTAAPVARGAVRRS